MWVREGVGERPSPQPLSGKGQAAKLPASHLWDTGKQAQSQQLPGPHLGAGGGGGCRVSPLRRRIEGRGQSSEGSEPSTGGPWGLGGRAWARVSLAAVPHILFLAVAKMLGVDPFLRGLS